MGVVRNGMVLLGVPAFYQEALIGTVILIAVLADTWLIKKD
jgi:simple sugar transport system permease protein/ribose transport system permease protein